MSYAYLVIYEGKPEDPEVFLDYYVKKHLSIVRTFPRIRRVEVHRSVAGEDFFMMARLTFDTLKDLRVAVESPQRKKARADMANFPPFQGQIRHHIVEILETPPEQS